jgi:hypothetical protein
MRKTNRKLVVNCDTVRALRALENNDLGRVVGGGDVVGDPQTGINCPAKAVVPPARG